MIGAGARTADRLAPRSAAVLLAIIASACSGAPEPPGTPTAPIGSAPITLALESVTVRDAVRELSRASGLAIVVGPGAERDASCARVSLTMPTPRPADEVVALLGAALAGSGLTLVRHAEGLVLAHDGTTRPPGCSLAHADLGAALPGLPSPSSAFPEPTEPELAAAVRSVSDTEWELTRRYRDAMLADPSVLSRLTRVIPYEVDGEVVGLRIYGIRRTSLLGALGFHNGDTLRTVNGHALSSPETGLEAYADLRVADQYVFAIDRRGEARTHTVRVVDELRPQ